MALVAVVLAMPLMPATFWERMSTITDEQQDKAHYTGSSEARRVVMQEGIDAFLEHPLTGVGIGQFKNYNPPGRRERWRETHNALIGVAAETGLFGLLIFSFLIVRGALVASRTRRLLSQPRRRDAPDPRLVLTDEDRRSLYAYNAALTAGLVGWFICALFAAVAYSWTFYYLLALIAATRELALARLAARTVEVSERPSSVPAAGVSTKGASRSPRRRNFLKTRTGFTRP
jgi:O-antigen ligase